MSTEFRPASVPPPGSVAAWRGIWSLTWRTKLAARNLPALTTSVLAVPTLAWFAASPGTHDGYVEMVFGIYLLLLIPLYCLGLCGAMIRDELQSGTLGFLITRPVKRARLYLVEWAANLVWLQLVVLANGAFLIAVAMLRSVPDSLLIGAALLLVQPLAVLIYSALSALLGLITRRYIVLGILYGFVVEIGIGQIPINVHVLSMTHHLRALSARCGPVAQTMDWQPGGLAFSLSVLASATLLFLAFGAALFTWREYHARETMQK